MDRLPVEWWRPGNVHPRLSALHFCDEDHVRSIEWNGRIVAQGRGLFPYGRWDRPDTP